MDYLLPEVSPMNYFETVNAYQRSAVLKGAIELDVFTGIAEGNVTVAQLAHYCRASDRGIRILCDYLVIMGFLTKSAQLYNLTQESAAFLNRHSPAFLGGSIDFLLSPFVVDSFRDIAETVRRGTTLQGEYGSVSPENPIWVKFAAAMAPLSALPARLISQLADPDASRPIRVLDIAAGHGLFGIAFAQNNPEAVIDALDWPAVLEVAKQNAIHAGVESRYNLLPGSAFEIEFQPEYDIVLLTNFLHHFDLPTCEKFLTKVYSALKPEGKAVTLEFVPNEDRVSPPMAAAFSMMMLTSTPAGDAYTFAELKTIFQKAGFVSTEMHPLPPAIQVVLISRKQ